MFLFCFGNIIYNDIKTEKILETPKFQGFLVEISGIEPLTS